MAAARWTWACSAFDGAFHTYGGNVFHQLGATCPVALPSTAILGSNVEHVASMDFRTDLLDAEAINVFGKTEKRYFAPGFVYTVENFDGASVTVDTQTMERVAGTVRLDMSLDVGQSFILIANLFSWTSPEPLIPVSGGLNYSESWGAVDGFNTGRLRIDCPGLSLAGPEGLLTSAVVTTRCPSPAPGRCSQPGCYAAVAGAAPARLSRSAQTSRAPRPRAPACATGRPA